MNTNLIRKIFFTANPHIFKSTLLLILALATITGLAHAEDNQETTETSSAEPVEETLVTEEPISENVDSEEHQRAVFDAVVKQLAINEESDKKTLTSYKFDKELPSTNLVLNNKSEKINTDIESFEVADTTEVSNENSVIPDQTDEESANNDLALNDESEENDADIENPEANDTTEVADENINEDVDASTTETTETTVESEPQKKNRNRRIARTKNTKRSNSLTQDEQSTVDYILNSSSPKKSVTTASGWVYLGRYSKQNWIIKTLNVGSKLPRIGKTYSVIDSVNLRSGRPAKTGQARLVKNLKKNQGVKILEVHPSGRNGHYWALVEPVRL